MRICFCGLPVFGTDKNTREGYCRSHQYMRTDLDKRPLLQRSLEKARTASKVISSTNLIQSGSAEMTRWFKERRLEMTGRCRHCGEKTCRDSDTYFKCSIAHILPKAYFRSVATHPLNWIELCFWGRSCHTNFDNYSLDISELNCYDEVIEKFVAMYPSIDAKERRRIPSVLLHYINVDI